jgi:hypothetical protein
MIAASGGGLFTFLGLLILSPLLLFTFYLAYLLLPVYLVFAVSMAIRNGGRARNACRAMGGQIPTRVWDGYVLLGIALAVLLFWWGSRNQNMMEQVREAHQQYGALYYPGAQPDTDFPGSLRTSDDFWKVSGFYHRLPLCDNRREYSGGGEYVTECHITPTSAPIHLRVLSRVRNNEPYVLIGSAP